MDEMNESKDLNESNEPNVPTEQPTNVNTGKGCSIAGLVLGILACILAWIYLFNIAALVFGIVGVVLAAIGSKRAKAAGKKGGIATAGLILSIIGLCLGFIGFMSCTLCVTCAVLGK